MFGVKLVDEVADDAFGEFDAGLWVHFNEFLTWRRFSIEMSPLLVWT